MDPELLDLLVCPDTHQRISVASDAMVSRVNARISDGNAVAVGGETVTEPIDGGLVREDGKVLYPIRDEIPILLIDEAIELDDSAD